MADRKPRSREVTDGFERAPARAMLRAVGLTDDHVTELVAWRREACAQPAQSASN